MKIYQCFRTGASQSIHNMCGSRNFYQGGPARWQENSLGSVFFMFCSVLFSPQPNYRGVPMVLFQRGPSFSTGGGGVQMLISIETHITCDFLSPSGSVHA